MTEDHRPSSVVALPVDLRALAPGDLSKLVLALPGALSTAGLIDLRMALSEEGASRGFPVGWLEDTSLLHSPRCPCDPCAQRRDASPA